MTFHTALGGGKKQGIFGLLRPSSFVAYWKARKMGGNLEGEGRYFGGLLLVSKDGIKFSYKEKYVGDHLSSERVLEECMKL